MSNPVHLLNFSGKPKVPLILQTEAAECGLVCMAMVANYYGHKIDLNNLRKEYAISLTGATLTGLINLSDKLFLSSRAIRVNLKELKNIKKPCILHWNLNHFVVLVRVRNNRVTIHDPAVGIREYDLDEASKYFTGVALELSPSEDFKPIKLKSKASLSTFWSSLSGFKRTLLQIITLSFILQFIGILTPFYMQLVIDEVVISEDYDFLTVLASAFALLLLIQLFITALRAMVILIMSNQLSIQMAANLLKHLLNLPMDYFEKRHIGDIVSRFSSLENIKELLTTGLIETIVDGIMAIGLIVMMFVYSVKLGLIASLAGIIYLLFKYIMYLPLRSRTEEKIVAQAKQNSNFMETIRGIQTIKLFAYERQRKMLWNNLYVDELNSGIKIGKLRISYQFYNGLIFGIENIIVIYLAANQVMSSVFTVGMLFAFMSYKRQFTEKISNLIDKFVEFKMMSLYLQRLADIALAETEKDLESAASTEALNGSISCKNLSFRYADDSPYLLQKLNLKIKAGSSVAIVGASGCGKTTLMKIMLGLLRPAAGQVFIDGQDIRKVGLRKYRQHIATVMQADSLLAGNIADNISFFAENIDQEHLYNCAKMASIHHDIQAMPMGYHSLIGDMGSGLSGGQIQRILLARALYKKPKILFLDEATAHLDVALESTVNQSISKLNITRIIVAHRPQTIATADKVIILFNGKASDCNTKEYVDCLIPKFR
ncbi:MAG TPA: peptidase domain-containing ABC transporter [Oceanospirillales bacterium]|nr:peptidase domain-containing ABC transporter [Oceanospirillales bacterium]